ncbi:MAG: hypothetical protein H6851_15615 [Geminicoccaceae bacterium]|nr:hypothetical protein [Geminicoccaceae bacterium]
MIYKIAFTIGIIIAVWKGFKLFETLRTHIADDPPRSTPRKPARGGQPRSASRQSARTVELVKCPKCGAYVPNGTICTSVEECTHKT